MNIINSRFVRRAGLGLLALGLFSFVLLYACSLSLKNQKLSFETEARNTATIIRSAMDVVDGVGTSLRALQGVEPDSLQADSYAKTVISNYSFVSGFGRFDKITEDKIAHFSSLKNTSDAGAFSLWWYDESGNRVTRGNNTTLGVVPDRTKELFPITLIRSQASFTEKKINSGDAVQVGELAATLTGFDVGSVDTLNAAIVKAGLSGRTSLVKAPEFWPRPDSILAIRTSYLGYGFPEVFKERTEKMDGGYWLEIDISGLSQLDGSFNGMGIRLSLIEDVSEFSTASLETENLYHHASAKSGYLLSAWFRPNEWLNTFTIGDQTITVSLTKERGLTVKSLLVSLTGTLLFLTLLGAILYLNNKRRKALKKQQLQSERLYQEQHRAAVTLSSIGDAVLTVDVENKVQYKNNAAERLLELSRQNINGLPVGSVIRLFDEQSGQRSMDVYWGDNFTSQQAISTDKKLVKLDGTSMAVNLTVSPLLDISGERSGSVIVLRDVSAEKELTKRLEHQVNHDSLTGLANRFQFEKSLEHLFESADENSGHALCIIDLDRFKQINDTCGHAAGDELLVQLSNALLQKIRAEDLLARLGGDEFGVIINNCDRKSADSVANRIHRFFKSFHFEYDDRVFPVRSSIGLVYFKPADSILDNVVCAADAACYEAKKNGRNSVHILSPQDLQSGDFTSEELWMPKIQQALDYDGFSLYLQPIVAAGASESVGARHHEVLLRMVDENQNLIYPVEFLKPAERYDLMVKIDQWVIRNTIEKIALLPESIRQDTFSINLSAASVGDDGLVESIQQSLGRGNVDPSQLCFEIDEDVVLNNLESANRLCRKLVAMGCSIALDDFGAGVSSLSALRDLPLKYLKIDGQFVADVVNSSTDEIIVRSIQSFAKSMGIESIAEKVESEAAYELLESIGVDYIQGYVIAEPAPIDQYLIGDVLAA